jgi:hypothetical protein
MNLWIFRLPGKRMPPSFLYSPCSSSDSFLLSSWSSSFLCILHVGSSPSSLSAWCGTQVLANSGFSCVWKTPPNDVIASLLHFFRKKLHCVRTYRCHPKASIAPHVLHDSFFH